MNLIALLLMISGISISGLPKKVWDSNTRKKYSILLHKNWNLLKRLGNKERRIDYLLLEKRKSIYEHERINLKIKSIEDVIENNKKNNINEKINENLLDKQKELSKMSEEYLKRISLIESYLLLDSLDEIQIEKDNVDFLE